MHQRIFPLLLFLVCLTALAQTPTNRQLPPDVASFMEGTRLSLDQVMADEKMLAGSPDDLNARLRLLVPYQLN